MITKTLTDLTAKDIEQYPVWIYTESIDNEEEITPYIGCASVESNDAIYFIAAQFNLADSALYYGYLRYAYGQVTFIALTHNGEFVEFSLIAEIQKSLNETAETFAAILHKTKEQVFPIQYETSLLTSDGSILRGLIL